ncbi:rho GTPase-activating protein 44-like [Stegodyphus dumicola]|uniref:rho GTPase-activating protein 44-like n=1 Tax=Stegodyphus dumicola TaxID=202533 RepID=UPI0015B17C82|nr:rho GTPase-activating protein 44-like [Stegodyphus dumicola]
MMKQFLRVKQIADQKFQRSDKNGVLTEELNAAERRVDLIKESCYASGKKLSTCMQRLVQDSSDRKFSKKIPEAALAQCMEEWGLSLGENSILGMTLVDYARVQEALANDLLTYKVQVEENVVEPLQNILNIDINKVMKYRKQLFKLTSDMESAKMRYQSALRSSQQATGNGAAAAAAKVQLLKEEAEDITSRADQCRDSLTAEMFNLISREPEMSQLFVKLCQLQLEYHKKAFYMLESALPELKAQISSCPYQPVFGVSLKEHLKVTKREIATVIETCVCWLLETAMEEEGLFRIGGSMIKIKKMKSAFDAGFQHLIEEDRDPHNVAGVLKLYLRSLPEPLLTFELYDQWMNAAVEADHDTRLRALWSVVNSLPEAHLKNLRYLIKFLAKLCKNSDVNKMSVQNISIVIGPNLLWPPVEECALGMNMTATNLHSSIVDTLITYVDWFFPGG